MSDIPYDGWWQASDGRWYPPDTQPGEGPGGPQAPPAGWYQDADGSWHPPQAPNGTPEPSERPVKRPGARRGAVVALVLAAAAVVAVVAGLLVSRHDPSPTEVDSKTEIQSTLPPATVIAPVPGSNSTSVAPSTTAPVTASAGP
jgi:hypothetical protein